MMIFLIICHYLVVYVRLQQRVEMKLLTSPSVILITVLTNSFMAIASNATEEHQ